MAPTATFASTGDSLTTGSNPPTQLEPGPDMKMALNSAISHMEAELKLDTLTAAKREEIERTINTLKSRLQVLPAGESGAASNGSTSGSSTNDSPLSSSIASSRTGSGVNTPIDSISGSGSSSSTNFKGPSRKSTSLFDGSADSSTRHRFTPPTQLNSSPHSKSDTTPSGEFLSRAHLYSSSSDIALRALSQSVLRYPDFYVGEVDSASNNNNASPPPPTIAGTTESGSGSPVRITPSDSVNERQTRYPSDASTLSDGETPPLRSAPTIPGRASSSAPLPSLPKFAEVVEISDDEDDIPFRPTHPSHIEVPSQATTISDEDEDDEIQFQSMSIRSPSETPSIPSRNRSRNSSLFNSNAAGKKRAYSPLPDAIDLTGEDDTYQDRPAKIRSSDITTTTATNQQFYHDMSDAESKSYMINVLQTVTSGVERLSAQKLFNFFSEKMHEYSSHIKTLEMAINGSMTKILQVQRKIYSTPNDISSRNQFVSLTTQKRVNEEKLSVFKRKYNNLNNVFNSVTYRGFRNFESTLSSLQAADHSIGQGTVERVFFNNLQTNNEPVAGPSDAPFGLNYRDRGPSLFERQRVYDEDEFGPPVTEKDLEDLISNIQNDDDIKPEDRIGTPNELTITLLEHQKLGLSWLQKMEDGRQKAGILADDMGLGKTIQVL